MTPDVIVLGGGHNGLAAATILAREGRQVLVLEKRAILGGLAAGEEFHPGCRTQGLHLDTSGLRRDVISELELERHGLKLRGEDPPVFIPSENGKGLILHRDPDRMQDLIGTGLSAEDLAGYRGYRKFIKRISGIVRHVLDTEPPPLADHGVDGMLQLLSTGLRLRALGRADMLELLRIAPMCSGDWLKEQFAGELVRSALAGPSVEGTFMGPWSAGTTAALLLRECIAETNAEGGPAAVVKALEAAAKEAGVEIRTGAPVKTIQLADGKAAGVVLEDGEEIAAGLIVSSCDPKTTFLRLISAAQLPLSLAEPIRLIRARGTAAKVNLALKGALEFDGWEGKVFEHIRTGETLDDIERAFDAVKYGEFSKKPHLEIKVPTVADPSLAPAGHHVVEILVHFAPYDLKGGWNDRQRAALGDTVVERLAAYAPKLKEQIVGREVLTPKDIEERYGTAGGHIYHGEPFLDQLYSLRPTVDTAQYATPIDGLYLCGSGSHPGGGVTCMPGTLAAEAVLARS